MSIPDEIVDQTWAATTVPELFAQTEQPLTISFELTPEQTGAAEEILAWVTDPDASRFFSLSGPAGAGKTTLLRVLAERFKEEGVLSVTWSATTGRAAVRLREAARLRRKVSTLHSALYHAPEEVDNQERRRIDLHFEHVREEAAKVLVVDEASMVGEALFRGISTSRYGKVLFVGDPYQIPPVEEEKDGFNLFSEVSGPELRTVLRTAGAIVEAATIVRETGQIPGAREGGGSRYDVVFDGNHNTCAQAAIRTLLDDPEDHVLVTWRNEVRMRLNKVIRQVLGRAGDLPEPGEPVVVCLNSHLQRVMNGDFAWVEEWGGEGPELAGLRTRKVRLRRSPPRSPAIGQEVLDGVLDGLDETFEILTFVSGGRWGVFDGTRPYVELRKWNEALEAAGLSRFEVVPLTYGYCLTAHKVQGSEFRRATTLLLGDLRSAHFRKPTVLPNGERMPFSTRWLYTSLSRARRHSTLLVGT